MYKCVFIMWRLTVNSITRGTSSSICVQAERRRHSRLLAIACNQSMICFEAWHPLCILITCTSHSLLTISVCNLRPGFTPGAWCCSLVHWDQNCNSGRTQHPAPRFNITHAARRACKQRVPWNTWVWISNIMMKQQTAELWKRCQTLTRTLGPLKGLSLPFYPWQCLSQWDKSFCVCESQSVILWRDPSQLISLVTRALEEWPG